MSMTLEEAIEHAEKVAEENEKISLYTPVECIPADLSIEQCQKCAEEHRQLADWLKELRERRKQPERKTGRWVNTEPDYKSGFGNNAHYCSVCKNYYTTSPSEMHYCPNCGADMRGEPE